MRNRVWRFRAPGGGRCGGSGRGAQLRGGAGPLSPLKAGVPFPAIVRILPSGSTRCTGNFVAVQEQEREQGPLPPATEGERPPIVLDLERTENPELH